MTNRERFEAVLNGKKADRTPIIEWAGWWNLTTNRWYEEGLPRISDGLPQPINRYFGQDKHWQSWFGGRGPGCPGAASHGAPILFHAEDYEEFRNKYLFTEARLEQIKNQLDKYGRLDPDGEFVPWFTLDGFFWFPRILLGIEPHLYAYYDEEELMLQINRDLCDFNKKVLELIYDRINPVFMTFAEDMSYNNGPMISEVR